MSGAQKVVAITGGYETPDAGTFELTFRGPVPDAEPVKEFLEQQLRGAKSTTVEATFDGQLPDHVLGVRRLLRAPSPRCLRLEMATRKGAPAAT